MNSDDSWWCTKHYSVRLILLQCPLPPTTKWDQVFIWGQSLFKVIQYIDNWIGSVVGGDYHKMKIILCASAKTMPMEFVHTYVS